MKKEARERALKIFLKAKGKVTNKQIADGVGVNPLTVGRWKRKENWERKLKELAKAPAKEAPPVVRKKAARDKALQIFIDLGGNVTNKALSDKTGVTPATISKWKQQDNWDAKLVPAKAEVQPVPEPAMEPKEQETKLALLISPEQIIAINKRIETILQRDHLTASEIAELAAAKRDMLDAVEIYVHIVGAAEEAGV